MKRKFITILSVAVFSICIVGMAIFGISIANSIASNARNFTDLNERQVVPYATNWTDPGIRATNWVTGRGTYDDPFIILTPAHMGLMGYTVDSNLQFGWGVFARNAYYVIAADIDLSGRNWPLPAGEFRGNITAINGSAINNLHQVTDGDGGLFAATGAGVEFRDLTFNNATIIATRNDQVDAGLLAASHNAGTLTIDNIVITNSEIYRHIPPPPDSRSSNIGGLIGQIASTSAAVEITNVTVDMTLDVRAMFNSNVTGGLIGRVANHNNSFLIYNATVDVDIYIGGNVRGGLIGSLVSTGTSSSNTIQDSYFNGTITVFNINNSANMARMGGFVGLFDGNGNNAYLHIDNSEMAGYVNAGVGGALEVGGFVGSMDGPGQNRKLVVTNSNIIGIVRGGAGASGVGGVLGHVRAGGNIGINIEIENVDMTGSVIRAAGAIPATGTGGLIGTIIRNNTNLTIRNILIDGVVSAGAGSTGGLVGLLSPAQNNAISGNIIIEDIEISSDTEILVNSIHGLTDGAAGYPVGGFIGLVRGDNIDMVVNRIDMQATISGRNAQNNLFGAIRGGGLFGAIRASNSDF